MIYFGNGNEVSGGDEDGEVAFDIFGVRTVSCALIGRMVVLDSTQLQIESKHPN